MVEYSFDRDDFRPRDDSQRDRLREEAMRDASRQERAFLEAYEDQARRDNEREAIREVVNNPNVTVTSSMIDAINDPDVMMMPNGSMMRRSSGDRGQFSRDRILPRGTRPTKRTRKKTKMDTKMSRALKQANLQLRKKNGMLRKGKTMKDVMRLAHRIAKKLK